MNPTAVPIIVDEHLDAEQVRAYRLQFQTAEEIAYTETCQALHDQILTDLRRLYYQGAELEAVSPEAPDIVWAWGDPENPTDKPIHGLFAVIPRETITSIDADSWFWRNLKYNFVEHQVYIDAAKRRGYDVVGVVYEVTRMPPVRPFLATPVEKRRYRKDGSLYVNQRAENEAPEDYAQRVRECVIAGPWDFFKRRILLDSRRYPKARECQNG